MAVKIRLRRMGAKKAPFYRIVVADSRYPRDGRFIEELGYYDPTKEPSVIKVDGEKAKKWISNGAQPTDTMKNLLKISGVLSFGPCRTRGRSAATPNLLVGGFTNGTAHHSYC